MENAVFWDVTPCGSCNSRSFGGTYRLIIRVTRIGELRTTFAELTTEARCEDLLYYTVLYGIVLYYTVLYCTVLYCTILCCTVLYYTVLYCTVLYCTTLHCTVLCYTILCSISSQLASVAKLLLTLFLARMPVPLYAQRRIPQYPLDRRLSGPQNGPGLEHRSLGRPARSQ
jgi:hypothetical protein